MTRRTRIGPPESVTEVLDGEAKAFLELDGRLVAEHVACECDVCPRVANVARPGLPVILLDRLAEDAADRLGETVDAGGAARRHVEDQAARAGCGSRAKGRVDHVLDVGEVTGLLAVAVDRHW